MTCNVTSAYKFATAGTYTVGFGVTNVNNHGYASALVVDNIEVNVQNPQSVPEIDASSATLHRLR